MPLNNFGVVDERKSFGKMLMRSAQPDIKGLKDIQEMMLIEEISTVRLNDCGIITLEQEQSCAHIVYNYPIPTFKVDLLKVREIVKLIDERLNYEHILVHCEHGRDRTGLIIGAYRILVQKWDLQKVDEERKLYGVSGIIEEIGDYAIHEALEELV